MINLEKEIREQPQILTDIVGREKDIVSELAAESKKRNVKGIYFAARGTSDHACIYAQYVFGILCGLPCVLGTPSVFTKYGAELDLSSYLVIGVSQSGKAEDVIAVIESAKKCGALTAAVTNEAESPLAKTADYHLYCGAGREYSIAATKTFTSQMMLLAMLAAEMSGNAGFRSSLEKTGVFVKEAIDSYEPLIKAQVKDLKDIQGATVLGRGISYPIALEGTLKMLETNKLKMKGYAISDFHHGPIAQIKKDDVVFVIAPDGKTLDDAEEITGKLLNQEADIYYLTDSDTTPTGVRTVPMPCTGNELTMPFVEVLYFQMLACYLTIERGIDPDKAGVINKITITK